VLDGSGIPIGQFEGGRPGKPGAGNDPDLHHAHVTPTAVFLQEGPATANGGINGGEIRRNNGHATNVAGVMIGNGPNANDKGVAPGAELYASAASTIDGTWEAYWRDWLYTAQRVIRPAANFSNDIETQVVNVSTTMPPFFDEGNGAAMFDGIDGNNFVNLGLDWISGTGQTTSGKNSLIVYGSGNRLTPPNILPAAYNGLVVASTEKDGNGVFNKVNANNSAFHTATDNGRQFINLVAPGVDIRVPRLGNPPYDTESGSSLAAPQVTGAVAMLAQYADYWAATINDPEHWNSDAFQPEVMKAVLMNSADKVNGRLGTTKTILDSQGNGWDDSDASDRVLFRNAEQIATAQRLPLDLEMGTGQLNVRRALDQYDAGEFHPVGAGNTLPTQAWDFNTINGQGNEQVYHLPALQMNSYISITLTWNRMVNLTERAGGRAGLYDQGEMFQPLTLSNLDLRLIDRTANNQIVWKSASEIQNVEHMFFLISNNNHEYDIVVRQIGAAGTNYSLAWWAQRARQGAGMVQGTAWSDADAGGTWGGSEDGKEGIFVNLYDAEKTWIAATTTDSEGEYEFGDLDPGNYYVVFTQPEDSTFTELDVGSNDAIDSDADAFGRTETVTIEDDEEFVLDAGFIPRPTGSVSGRVWNDDDSDGIQDGGEASQEGVLVGLYDDADNLIDVAATDEDGAYEFNWLDAGDYYVSFVAPVNFDFTDQDAGSNDAVDGDADGTGTTATFSLTSSQQKEHVDAGIDLTSSSVRGWVWNDIDEDGIQDTDEYAVQWAEVELFDTTPTLIASTMTDENGEYRFDNLDADDYYIVVTKPFGYASFSDQNEGSDDTVDSDVDSDGETASFSLGSAEIKDHVDAGLISVEYGSIGDTVWEDMNNNGAKNSGEPGIAGVFVDLYDSEDNWAGSAMTDAAGHYEFLGVAPGDYYLVFELPDGESFTTQNQGSDDAVDSDVDTNGETATFTLDPGEEKTDLDAGFHHTNIAPVLTVPGAQTVNEDGTLVLSPGNGNAVSIADADAGSGPLEMSISTNMYVTLNLNGVSGLTFTEGDGTADPYMVFTGTLANINAALNGISFVPDPNWHGQYLIVDITIDDQGNTGGGTLTDDGTIYITVNSVNDAPSGADNPVYTSQNTDYVFSTSDFGFSDSIDGDSFLAVKITSLPTTGTLYWNNGSSWVAVTASQFISASDISAGKLKYTPPASYTGSPTFTFKVQDDGGTAFGGIDLDPIANTITINVS
jgi:hypothetical protein